MGCHLFFVSPQLCPLLKGSLVYGLHGSSGGWNCLQRAGGILLKFPDCLHCPILFFIHQILIEQHSGTSLGVPQAHSLGRYFPYRYCMLAHRRAEAVWVSWDTPFAAF